MLAKELSKKNKDMNEKMLTLMDLTKAVLKKIKNAEKNEYASDVNQDYKVMADLDNQLKMTDKRLQEEYKIVKM